MAPTYSTRTALNPDFGTKRWAGHR